MTEEFDLLEWLVIHKMYRKKYIGGRYTNERNIPKGFPKHIRDQIKEALESLIKRSVVMVKPTSYGREVSLNPDYPDIYSIMGHSVEIFEE